MKYLITKARIIDPANNIDDALDILVSDGKIDKIEKNINVKADETIDAKGKIVTPGFVDMHAHLRQPGREDKETISTGTKAAVKGGFTSVLCMPNTEPALDNPKIIKSLNDIISKDALSEVLICGAITCERAGIQLADFKSMKKEGIIAVSDDGSSVDDAALMEKALKQAYKEGIALIEHCEDKKLSNHGIINEGLFATKMGLKGISKRSEYERIERNLILAEKLSAPIHIAHVSCKESADLIRKAKKKKIAVTAETAPHYFVLTEENCADYNTNTKINPPLRTKDDVKAIKEALADGTIDAIATDHAPHTDWEKDVEFEFAPFGIIGLETALSLSLMELVDKNVISLKTLIEKLSLNPSKILQIDRGNLAKGKLANITIINPDKEYVYKRESIESKSKNSPFINWKLKGKVESVFIAGKLVMKNETLCLT